MNIQRSVPSEITELEAAYKKAFESNVFPEYMIEDACDDEPDLSPAISISRDDLITLTIYEDGRIIGGAILDCPGPSTPPFPFSFSPLPLLPSSSSPPLSSLLSPPSFFLPPPLFLLYSSL